MPVIRVKQETLERVIRTIEAIYPSRLAKRLIELGSWDMKINLILDALEGSVCSVSYGSQIGW
ncbi:hypothetical protein DRO58_06260 [Candidatus Bathyarchaeota archaeon]|nr:MAG: hypothetical protein DRO58_06260 [Candidatus Bathyarchaeota archaeon]